MAKKVRPEDWYQQLMDARLPKKKIWRNGAVAFLSGGLLCALAELTHELLMRRGMTDDNAASLVLILVIGIAALFTGFGVYDKAGQKLGAGLAVPISGFSNSVAASMLEHKCEGLVLGTGCNSFKLAGAVVVFGIASAFAVSVLALIFGALPEVAG